jgi:epoxyqueuosine reductase QueG
LNSEKQRNLQAVSEFFNRKLADTSYDGIIGVANFQNVCNDLMPAQKTRIEQVCGEQFQNLLKNGSIICIAVAYPERVIDCVNTRLKDGTVDEAAWNVYAKEYSMLNRVLNAAAKDIADRFGDIPIPATTEVAVKTVDEYYGKTISHRVVAENAGLGWRGKNELIVNEKFSCAIRFASIITSLPLSHGKKLQTSCGECTACLEACPILKNKNGLQDYRENCRGYIINLGLETHVCGKCIKACYRHSIYSNKFKLR